MKTFEIIRNVLLFIAFFLGVLIFCLESEASPMRDNTVSANLSIKVVKDYIDNKVAQDSSTGNVLVDNSSAILDGVEYLKSFLPPEIQAFVGPAAYASPISTTDFLEAYENNDLSYFELTFDLQSTNDLSNLDDYLSKYSNYIIENVESNIIIYQTVSYSNSGDWVNNELNGADVSGEIFQQYSKPDGDIFPIYFYRDRQQWCTTSFIDTNNNNTLCVDGLICSSSSVQYWGELSNNIDYFRKNGYLPSGTHIINFEFYNNSAKVNAPFYHTIQHSSQFPSTFKICPYDVVSSEGIRNQSGLMSLHPNDYVFLLFRSQAEYTRYNSSTTKSILPYDFSSNFPNTDFSTLDFSQILQAIRDNGVLEIRNTQELYKRLNETLEQGIQDIIDGQKTTNELLLALLRYYDKNIVKTGENITDILLDINKAMKNISSPDDEEISSYLDTIIQDPSIENRLKHIFPFGVFQDVKDLTDILDEVTVLEPRWDFRLNIGLFEEKYVDYSIDLTTVPEIDIFRSFWFFFILLAFNLLCLGIEYKFLCMFMGGGD